MFMLPTKELKDLEVKKIFLNVHNWANDFLGKPPPPSVDFRYRPLPRTEEEYHFDLLIDMELCYVLYNTFTECVFVIYKAHFENASLEDIFEEFCLAKEFTNAANNKYHNMSFVIEPERYTRIVNDKFVGLISNVVLLLKGRGYLLKRFIDTAMKFEDGAFFKVHSLSLDEIVKRDVLFVAPRTK